MKMKLQSSKALKENHQPANHRRRSLKQLALTSGVLLALPMQWKRPVVNQIMLPAHAQTSTPPGDQDCSAYQTEPVSEPISITLTDTEARGPIVVPRVGASSFDGDDSSVIDSCRNNQDLSQEVEFSGAIDVATKQLTGDLVIRQFCGSLLVCEQIATFAADQDDSSAPNELGDYSGTLTGTIRCCVDFL